MARAGDSQPGSTLHRQGALSNLVFTADETQYLCIMGVVCPKL